MLTVKACSQIGVFTEWSHEVIHSLFFGKYISYDHHLLFENVSNFMEIPELE